MTTITNSKLKQYYIKKFHVEAILPKEVVPYMELVSYDQGETILNAHEEMRYFYFMVDGLLKLYQVHENGRTLLIQFYTSFNSLGEVEFMTEVPITCSVSAVKGSLLLRVPFDVMRSYALDYSQFLTYIVKSLSEKLVISERHHSYNLLYPVKNRLASYLKVHMNEQGTIKLNNTLQEVSEFIGTTYRQLHRAFISLETEKIVLKSGKNIRILNSKKLEDLAGHIYHTF